ncbi:MAG: ATP-dependent RecD-like DNA helicase [Deltaproteobacteria bacterium]|nr:ATP-dependent RecD-like DNA helicase [Deltaproteobacteria bacterium]
MGNVEKNSENLLRTSLQGEIKSITYSDTTTGWTAARADIEGEKQLVVIVGTILQPKVGDILDLEGEWVNHPKYGKQFKFDAYTPVYPNTINGITAYLGSGLIRGIGPELAKRIVKMFGKDTFEVIENKPDLLRKVSGIAEKRVDIISKAFKDQKEIRNVMVFLKGHGISTGYATKIYKRYGNDSIKLLTENPYRLCEDIFGIGFLTADKIAERMGFSADHPLRVKSGVLYVMSQLGKNGHVYCPFNELIEKADEFLGVSTSIVRDAVITLAREKHIVVERDESNSGTNPVYEKMLHVCECRTAERLRKLAAGSNGLRLNKVDLQKVIAEVEQEKRIKLAPEQRQAVQTACESKVMVITGSPGTGKTTIIESIAGIYNRKKCKVIMCAPTGRAAKRMTEATGFRSSTIHRLLEYTRGGIFQRDEHNPLEGDLFVVDEASMIDTILMYSLLRAIPLHATLVLVGDIYQLPSVGPGNVLKDIIESKIVPTVYLTNIFRQAKESSIIVNAHRINGGQMPVLEVPGSGKDFWFIEQTEPETIRETIIELMTETFKNRNPMENCQVLTPIHKGPLGTEALNDLLQEKLNPNEIGVVRGFRKYKMGDKVMQIKNNYDKDVFNGDIGFIAKIDTEEQEIHVKFEDKVVNYELDELDELMLSYVCTIHKVQGSEYPAVIIPMVTQHYIMLARNLLYTGVTRGEKLVVLIGSKKAVAMAVRNNRVLQRYTGLKERLKSGG